VTVVAPAAQNLVDKNSALIHRAEIQLDPVRLVELWQEAVQ
jgi:hypothetical protein